MYLSRIVRIFWEEPFYYRKGDTREDFVQESLKIYQLENLSMILSDFIQVLSEKKDLILQRSSEFQLKSENFNQLNQLETNAKSSATRLGTSPNIGSFDYSLLSSSFEEVFAVSNKIVEGLKFVNYLYDFPSLKYHIHRLPKNIQTELLVYKYKDLIKKTNLLTIQNWIEQYFDIALKENDCASVSNKLDEINFVCPRILTESQKEIITADMLIKYSEDCSTNDIAKKNMIDKAVQLMINNPYKIKIEYVIKVLGDNHKLLEIIKICVLKSSYLKALLDEDYLEYFSGLSMDGTSTANASNLDRVKNLAHPAYSVYKAESPLNTIVNNRLANSEFKESFDKDSRINFYKNFNLTNQRLDNNQNRFSIPYRDNPNMAYRIADDYSARNKATGIQNEVLSSSTSYNAGNPIALNKSFSGFENIYDLNNLENNHNYCEFKKCIFTILEFLEQLQLSIQNHQKIFNKKSSQQYISSNPNDSFADFFYNNLKQITDKSSDRAKAKSFNIFSFIKFLALGSKPNSNNPALSTYDAQIELISNLIKEIIFNKLWDFSLDEKIELRSSIIDEILKNEKFKFLHILVFDHLKAKGMIDEIYKYKSPYVEEYLRKNAMENEDYSDLKTNNSLISFYINDKNYIKAFDLLIKLAYQDNSLLSAEAFEKNSVSISRRIDCLKKAAHVLDKVLQAKTTDEEQKNYYSLFKEKITKKTNVLEIQNEIKYTFKKVLTYQQKTNKKLDLTFYYQVINDLDYSVYDMQQLYFEYAYRFKLHEVKIMILFENFKIRNSPFLPYQQVKDVYADAINFFVLKDDNYPESLINLVSYFYLFFSICK